MNRKKKINQILAKRLKKARTKKAIQNGNSKPRYISKADRAKLETETSDHSQENHQKQPR